MNTIYMPNIADALKGNAILIAGIVLLLHTLGLTMQAIYYLMIAGSLFLIAYGFVQAGYYHMLMHLIAREHDTHSS